MLRRHVLMYLALIPLLYVLFVFVLYPVLLSVITSLEESGTVSMKFYRDFFVFSKNLTALKNTMLIGFSTVVVGGLIGGVLAFLINAFKFKWAPIANILVIAPMMIPGNLYVMTIMKLYGGGGIITHLYMLAFGLDKQPWEVTGFGAIMLIHALTQYILFYIILSAGISKLDMSVIEAARGLGAKPWRVLKDAVLPMMVPSIISGSILTFIGGISSYAAPSMVGGTFKTMTVQIAATKTNGQYELASVQAIMLSLICILLLILMRYYESSGHHSLQTRFVPITKIVLKGKAVIFHRVLLGLMLFFIVMPLVSIILLSFVPKGLWVTQLWPERLSFENYVKFFSTNISKPFLNSIVMSFGSMVAAIVVGSVCAYIIVRTKLWVRKYIELATFLPWAFPASAIAVNAIIAYNEPNPLVFNQVLIGTYWILPLMYFVCSLPLLVRTTSAILSKIPDSLEEASRSLGASQIKSFLSIIVPMSAPGIASGGLLVFLSNLEEYTISSMLYIPDNVPISMGIMSFNSLDAIGVPMVFGVMMMVISAIILTTTKFSGKELAV